MVVICLEKDEINTNFKYEINFALIIFSRQKIGQTCVIPINLYVFQIFHYILKLFKFII
jgi:hypothetical protein